MDGRNAGKADRTPSVASLCTADEDVWSAILGDLLGRSGVSSKTQDPLQLPGDYGIPPSTKSPPGEEAEEASHFCLQHRERAHRVTWWQYSVTIL